MIDRIKSLMSLPPLASEHGARVDDLILYLHYLMAALFVIWIVYFFYVLYRFSARRNPKASYEGYSGGGPKALEIGVAVVEGVLLVGLAIPLWAQAADGFPKAYDASGKPVLDKDGKPAVTVIRVTAQQFAWNSRYPGADGLFGKQDLKHLTVENRFAIDKADPNSKDDLLTAEMVVPVNKPVILNLTSMDVIHSFSVHPFRLTQDAIPGISIASHVVPTQTGDYQITCAQLCGNAHYSMKGWFKVRSQAEYDTWLAAQPKFGAGGASFE